MSAVLPKCQGCGKPGGHPGRRSLYECPPLARAVVREFKERSYRWVRWAAGDDDAFTDSIEEVRERERREEGS